MIHQHHTVFLLVLWLVLTMFGMYMRGGILA
jgi:hypothetical protein